MRHATGLLTLPYFVCSLRRCAVVIAALLAILGNQLEIRKREQPVACRMAGGGRRGRLSADLGHQLDFSKRASDGWT